MDRNRHLGSTPSFDPGPLFLDRGSIIADRSSRIDHRGSIIADRSSRIDHRGSIIEERFEHRGSDRVRARVGAWVSKKLRMRSTPTAT